MVELNEHDAAILRNTRRRVNRARNFPENTCAASRHLHLMADQVASGKPYPMLAEEPQHCAMTMLAVLESLWKARTELARLKRHNAGAEPREASASGNLLCGNATKDE